MAVKLRHGSFISSRSSNPWLSQVSVRNCISCKREADLASLLSSWGNSRKRSLTIPTQISNGNHGFNRRLEGCKENFHNSSKIQRLSLPASAEDGVTVNGSPQASTSDDVEEMRAKLNQSLQDEDYSDGLVQSLHDAARVFELAIKEQISLSKMSWFSTAWLGVDRNAWVKTLSYQASVYSLLQAASDILSRGDGGHRDINISLQRSLLRLSAPLESMIRDKLSAKQPEAYDWFWSEQVPVAVTSFVNYFEGDPRFIAATAVCEKDKSSSADDESDILRLMLALTCIAAITKLGPAKVSCMPFFSMIADTAGRFMDILVDLIPIRQAYRSIKNIGLGRKFLVHFGPRAAACRVKNDRGSDEVIFWVHLIQKQLQQAIDREKIWSRLTTSESIEVLERDLAIFGFFIALGRSTQSLLSANGFDVMDDPLESFVRYLIGGSVLYYPQLASISSYQLYVEVVCEELDWITFYPGGLGTQKYSHGHGSKREGSPNAEAIPQVLDVCSHWIQSFIKYSKWPENPSNVKTARFLSRGHNKLIECMEELGILECGMTETDASQRNGSVSAKESDSFDKALESVEEALIRLEKLLQELHVSSPYSGKEQLKAACSDLEKIRKLKKEAEFLEASFRAKAASLQQGDDSDPQSSTGEPQQYLKGKNKSSVNLVLERSNRGTSKSRGLWNLFMRFPTRKGGSELSVSDKSGGEFIEKATANTGVAVSESSEIRRFELLRNELIELEKRVQRTADQSEIEEDVEVTDECPDSTNDARGAKLVHLRKKENIIEKSIDKLKETTTDVWQGTQLLAIDVAAAMGLLRRTLIGDQLTEKEKKALQRTMTDLASVVPIGFLMLLPVTAVGHAAMLAAIQRYVPSLIPSTYGPERLDLLRQLEKVKEMETNEIDPEENTEKLAD